MKELLESKHPTAWSEFEMGLIDEVRTIEAWLIVWPMELSRAKIGTHLNTDECDKVGGTALRSDGWPAFVPGLEWGGEKVGVGE
jgi:hypothetical protein